MIELQHVSAGYGAQDVVRDVSFTAPNGQLTALIGPNGSGKTTLLRAMTRTLPCRSGNIFLRRFLQVLKGKRLDFTL